MKIRFKLALLVAGTLMILLPLLSYIYYLQVRKTFLENVYSHLESISETKAIRLRDMAEKRFELITLFSTHPAFKSIINTQSPEISPLTKAQLFQIIERYQAAINSFDDINLTAMNGTVLISSQPGNIGADFSQKISFRQAYQGKTFWGEFHKNDKGELNTYLSCPLLNSSGKMYGILIISTKASDIVSLTSDYTGLGKTGETVLGIKDQQTILVNTLRHDSNALLETKLNPADNSIPMNVALQGKEGIIEEGQDYRNVEVIASTRFIQELGWGMVTKIDKEEAFSYITRLMRMLILINLAGVAVTFLIAYQASRFVSRPVEQLMKTVNKMKGGDLSQRAPVSSNDEIGLLASSFNGMADNLQRKIEDIENFTYTISHDLKAPIANLEGLTTRLEKSLQDKAGENDLKIFALMKQSISKFRQTLTDLGQVTKAQLSTAEDAGIVSFEEVLTEVKLTIAGQIQQASAQIYNDFSCNNVRFSRKELYSILLNLLTNAIKYSSPLRPPVITLSTKKTGNQILLTVEDNGLGFDTKHKDKLFGIFKRLHTHVEGTGIGLYLVKKMVESSGGKIEVDSTLDKGSVFSIYFKV